MEKFYDFCQILNKNYQKKIFRKTKRELFHFWRILISIFYPNQRRRQKFFRTIKEMNGRKKKISAAGEIFFKISKIIKKKSIFFLKTPSLGVYFNHRPRGGGTGPPPPVAVIGGGGGHGDGERWP